MKKGVSGMVITIIMGLLLIAIVLFVLYGPSGLLTRSEEQAFSKLNTVPGQESSQDFVSVDDYFGRQVYLPGFVANAMPVLFNVVRDCYDACKKKDSLLFCNYVSGDLLVSYLSMKEFKNFLASKDKQLGIDLSDNFYSNFENIGSMSFSLVYSDGRKVPNYIVNSVEICCNDDEEVFITPLNECLKIAKEES